MGVTGVTIEISPGEAVDRLTILEIKTVRIDDPVKRANCRHELDLLTAAWRQAAYPEAEIGHLRAALKAVNERLWVIEDQLRDCEREDCFGGEFIALARAVYHENDARAALKRQINEALGSTLVEEKSYREYRRPA